MYAKIKPLFDRILVERVVPSDTNEFGEQITKGGLVTPHQSAQKPLEGVVVEISDGVQLPDGNFRPCRVKPGDRIIFGKYSYTTIEVLDPSTGQGRELLIVTETQILGVIETDSDKAVTAVSAGR